MKVFLVVAILFLAGKPVRAGVIVGVQNSAPQPMYGSVVQVDSCLITPTLTPVGTTVLATGLGYAAAQIHGWVGAVAAAGGAAAIGVAAQNATLVARVANDGVKTADLVRIRVEGAGAPVYVRDDAPLAGGDVVNRKYSEGKAFGAGWGGQERAVACSVDFVHFTDGTTWSAAAYREHAP